MRNFIFLVLTAIIVACFASIARAQCQANFNSTSTVNVAGFPDSLVAGDFNRDGKLDLAVASKNLSSVSILMNQGARHVLTLSYDTGNSPSALAAADFNKDGNVDLVVANQGSNTFTLMRGNGLGGFIGGFTFSTQAQPSSITFADFNLDGSQDIAVLHLGNPVISIYPGDGTGNFFSPLNISHSQFKGGTKISVSDVNLDGKPDIVALGKIFSGGFDYETIIVALANGTGGFGAFNFYGQTGWSGTVADFSIADVNNDGKPDIVSTMTTISNGVKYTVARGNGTGAYPQGNTTYDTNAFDLGRSSSLAIGDFNSDGKVDLAFSNEVSNPTVNFHTLPGNGNGLFSSAAPFAGGGGNALKIITADFNGDGKTDLAASDSIQNRVHITLNTCGGLKPFPKADFDGDGKTDIAIFRPSVGEWWYSKSSTGGNAAFQFGSASDRITPGDFTGDGKIDLAFFRPSTGFWFIFRSEDSSFYSFPFGANGDVPATGDYDGDGKTDPAVFRPSTSTWYINLSGGGTTIVQFGQSGDMPVAAD